MIALAHIVLVILLMTTLHVYNVEVLQRPRQWRNYDREKIHHVADSLLNNWAQNEMKRDTL